MGNKKDDNDESEADECEEIRKMISTPQFDPRFPNANQTQRCFIHYVDFYRCEDLLGQENDRCQFFKNVFTSLCPHDWVKRWDDQREAGTFPAPIRRIPVATEDKVEKKTDKCKKSK